MPNKIICIHGSYYNKNFGDYLLLKRVCDLVVEQGDVPKLPFASRSVIDEFNGGITPITVRDLVNTKNCIFGGGGYFGEPPTGVTKWSINFLRRHFLAFIVLKLFRIKISIIGAGFGPITKAWLKPFVRYMLNNSEVVMLRDIESINYANKIAPRVSAIEVTDLAQDKVFLRSEVNAEITLPRKFIAIHIGAIVNLDLEEQINRLIINLYEEGYEFVFFSDSPGHNANLVNNNFSFHDFFAVNGIPYSKIQYKCCSHVLSIIEGASGLITGKLHTGIVASTLNTPVLSIPLHTKTLRYYSQIGFSGLCTRSGTEYEQSVLMFSKLILGSETFEVPPDVSTKYAIALNEIKERIK